MRPSILIALLAALVPAVSRGQSAYQPYMPITGLARVTEGDVLTVNGTLVRLYALDAPELGQFCTAGDGRPYDCGLAARNILTRLIGDRTVACTLFSRLPSGTEVGVCTIDGKDLGALMVMSGWAFSARALSNRYERHEAHAQAAGRGLWSGQAVRPWVWRQEQAEAGFR